VTNRDGLIVVRVIKILRFSFCAISTFVYRSRNDPHSQRVLLQQNAERKPNDNNRVEGIIKLQSTLIKFIHDTVTLSRFVVVVAWLFPFLFLFFAASRLSSNFYNEIKTQAE
jgi:hypothetical protein